MRALTLILPEMKNRDPAEKGEHGGVLRQVAQVECWRRCGSAWADRVVWRRRSAARTNADALDVLLPRLGVGVEILYDSMTETRHAVCVRAREE